MVAPRKRVGLPKPDRRNLGQWLPVTRESDPEAFRTPEEQRQADARYAASEARLRALQEGESAARLAGPEAAGSDSESGQEVSEPDDEGHSTYQPSPVKGKKKGKARQTVQATEEDEGADLDSETDECAVVIDASEIPADALELDDDGWKVNQPKTQPLTYAVPINDHGGTKYMKIAFTVDFDDKESVALANKRRHLARGRARKKAGLGLLRPSMKGRHFTQANYDWIRDEHDRYAAANNGTRIPAAELQDRYMTRFPGLHRSQSTLRSFIDRKQELKDKRNSYK